MMICIAALMTALQALAIDADQAMAKAIAAVSGAPAIEADFVATAADGATAKGQMVIAREKFAMVTPEYGSWYDGTSLWAYYKHTGEASLTIPTAEELMEINPFDMITHSPAVFKSAMGADSGTTCTVKLTPLKPGASAIKSATLVIDKSTWLPVSVHAVFSNGAGVKISITSARVLASAPAISEFRFPQAKYPGVEVVDLR